MSSGISMYALATLLRAILGWNFHLCIAASGVVVLVYIFMGGLRSAIYNEVLQFFLIVFGFLPLVLLGLKQIGGWSGLKSRLAVVAAQNGMAEGAWSHSWRLAGSAHANPMGIEWFGLVMGLGFVLSFGYWCTDFLVVQRAMAAESMSAARRTPIIAAFPKMLFPFLVILPGMLAIGLHVGGDAGFTLPSKGGSLDYDMVVPAMLARFFPSGMLGLGLTALIASFMSGMAGNVTAFNTVWTYDIYQSYIRPGASDAHYLKVGRAATVAGIAASIACAYTAAKFNNIMDVLQLVFAFVNAPLFATFLLGMFWRRTTGHGAFFGLLSGTAAAAVHHGLSLPKGAEVGIKGGWLEVVHHYPSEMAQNFWTAIWAFSACFIATACVSLATKQRRSNEELTGLVYALTPRPKEENVPWHRQPAILGGAVLALTLILNLVFW
jgi:SSS family solute:Na+ symporter